MRLAIVLIFVFFNSAFLVNAENHKDSLISRLRQLNDSILVEKNEKAKLRQYLSLYEAYRDGNNYTNAVLTLLEAIPLADSLNEEETQSDLLYYASVMYNRLKKNNLALDYAQRALTLSEQISDSINIGASCHRIGLIYESEGDITKAREYLERSYFIRKELGNKYALAASSNALGLTYLKENSDKAFEYFHTAFTLWNSLGDNEGISIAAGNLADIYTLSGDLTNAKKYLLKSYTAAKSKNDFMFLRGTSKELSNFYFKKGQTDSAYFYLSEYTMANDSFITVESNRVVDELQVKYDNEKHQQEIAYQKELIKKTEDELVRQRYVTWGTLLAVLLLLTLLALAIVAFRQKKKAMEILHYQKSVIEEKNKSITDSINYAKRIQDTLLKNDNISHDHFSDFFVLYKPKDIVSGDFFWTSKNLHYIYIAAADCTGHGVPGAFMSMLGLTFLNDIIKEKGTPKPSEILELLRERIIKELSQSENSEKSKDGMDISLVRLNTQTNELEWAGANNPLYLVSGKQNHREISIVSPDKQPIGFSYEMHPFTNHLLSLNKSDVFYIFTDGFADQFGGERGKKYKYSKLKDTLLEISSKPMKEQKEILVMEFDNWRGNLEQVDDVCIIGVKV